MANRKQVKFITRHPNIHFVRQEDLLQSRGKAGEITMCRKIQQRAVR